jgi:hypothetical protein
VRPSLAARLRGHGARRQRRSLRCGGRRSSYASPAASWSGAILGASCSGGSRPLRRCSSCKARTT